MAGGPFDDTSGFFSSIGHAFSSAAKSVGKVAKGVGHGVEAVVGGVTKVANVVTKPFAPALDIVNKAANIFPGLPPEVAGGLAAAQTLSHGGKLDDATIAATRAAIPGPYRASFDHGVALAKKGIKSTKELVTHGLSHSAAKVARALVATPATRSLSARQLAHVIGADSSNEAKRGMMRAIEHFSDSMLDPEAWRDVGDLESYDTAAARIVPRLLPVSRVTHVSRRVHKLPKIHVQNKFLSALVIKGGPHVANALTRVGLNPHKAAPVAKKAIVKRKILVKRDTGALGIDDAWNAATSAISGGSTSDPVTGGLTYKTKSGKPTPKGFRPPQTHEVQEQEYGGKIASLYTGDSSFARIKELFGANPERTGSWDAISPGEVLNLPDGWVIATSAGTWGAPSAPSPSNGGPIPAGPGAPTPTVPTQPATAAYKTKSGKTPPKGFQPPDKHEVQNNEYAVKIAQLYTGTTNWKPLKDANPERNGSWDAMAPGEVLNLPAGWVVPTAGTPQNPGLPTVINGTAQQIALLQSQLAYFHDKHVGDGITEPSPRFGTLPASDLSGKWDSRATQATRAFQIWRNVRNPGAAQLRTDGTPDEATINALTAQNQKDMYQGGTPSMPSTPSMPGLPSGGGGSGGGVSGGGSANIPTPGGGNISVGGGGTIPIPSIPSGGGGEGGAGVILPIAILAAIASAVL